MVFEILAAGREDFHFQAKLAKGLGVKVLRLLLAAGKTWELHKPLQKRDQVRTKRFNLGGNDFADCRHVMEAGRQQS
jgi:hypothetical protein